MSCVLVRTWIEFCCYVSLCRNWTACYIASQWSPSGSWGWIRRMDRPQNHVNPTFSCNHIFYCNRISNKIEVYGIYRLMWIFYGSGDFTAFSAVCFKEFGNAVKFWSTINEPNIVAWVGYDLGSGPPSHCSPPFGMVNCSKGNSSTEPYIALHNMLLAHASTARLYKQKYKASVIHTYVSLVPAWIARYDYLSLFSWSIV